ncbi:MAG: glycoside hydrolase family 18 [Draconibacterium sp.]
MKTRNIKISLLAFFMATLFTGCNDWLETESVNDTDLNTTIKSEEYYAALREWKSTPGLPQVFVWFDNWNGISPTGENSLRGLPDSVTIASNWGGHPKFDLSPERKADMEYVQQVKGTKVVVTLFSAKVGDDMPEDEIYNIGNSSDEAVVRPAIRKYAEAIYDAVVAAGYDGFDWDYEPWGGGNSAAYLWRNNVQSKIFIEELGYWFGSGSQRTDRDGRKPAIPGLLFLVDGEVGVGKGMGQDWESQYIDYFVLQAYGSTSDANRTYRVSGVLRDMAKHIESGAITEKEVIRRTILTENFESYANSGGGFLGMSEFIFKPEELNQQIGGCGLYRSGFDYAPKGKGDYNGSPEYYFLRKGITNIFRIFNERQNATEQSSEAAK